MIPRNLRWSHAIILALALLAACAKGEPFDPPRAGEIPAGQGLFSGDDGEFKLFRR